MSVERIFLRRLIGEPIISVIMVTIGLMSIIDGIIYLTPFRLGKLFFSGVFASNARQHRRGLDFLDPAGGRHCDHHSDRRVFLVF